MHPLVRRQLRKAFPDGVPATPELAALADAVGAAYQACDDDRAQLERSLELASRELVARNQAMTLILDTVAQGLVTVGLDGRSGAGKSTIAATVAEALRAEGTSVAVVEGDDFYLGGTAATWDARSAAEKVDTVIDWRAQRPLLEALRAGEATAYRPFDWDSDDWDAEERPMGDPVAVEAAPVVILEGAYSCRPELHDLLDVTALLDVPQDVRRARLLAREGDEHRADWESRWSEAEDHYFGSVMPPDRFDLVVRDDG